MFISKKRLKRLEDRISDLENRKDSLERAIKSRVQAEMVLAGKSPSHGILAWLYDDTQYKYIDLIAKDIIEKYSSIVKKGG